MVEGLRNRRATNIDRLVPSEPPTLTVGQLKELESKIAKEQAKFVISASRRWEIDEIVEDFIVRTNSYVDGPDVALAMKRILLHWYAGSRTEMRIRLQSLLRLSERLDGRKNVINGCRCHSG